MPRTVLVIPPPPRAHPVSLLYFTRPRRPPPPNSVSRPGMMDAEGGPSGPDPPRDPESTATGELPLPPGPGRESEGGPTRGSGGVDPIVGHSEGGGGGSPGVLRSHSVGVSWSWGCRVPTSHNMAIPQSHSAKMPRSHNMRMSQCLTVWGDTNFRVQGCPQSGEGMGRG